MPSSEKQDSLLVIGVFAAVVALVGAVFAVGLSARAVAKSDDASVASTGAAAVTVSLTEFAISPAEIRVSSGQTLTVVNDGNVEHDFVVQGQDLATPLIAPGSEEALDVSGLADGSYEVFCSVPGHEGAGMRATLVVGGAVAAGGGGHAGHDPSMSPEEMDEVMAERTLAFPAETEGKGGEVLEPQVLADGTKVFELTTEIVDWEVEPGKIVQAWTYNGTVPGPTLKANVGDKVRVVVTNELPESTALHLHGILIPNAMDGVPDITQPPIKPGETFTYEFTAREPAVGMYHSHHNAAVQTTNGLAGAFLIGQVDLPDGVTPTQELPMMLNDSGTIGYSIDGKSFPATAPIVAKLGDKLLVHYMNEGTQIHPMHLHGIPQLVVARDGYALPEPYKLDTVNVAPGERWSVLIDVSEPGVWAWHCHILTHAESSDGMFGMVTALVVE